MSIVKVIKIVIEKEKNMFEDDISVIFGKFSSIKCLSIAKNLVNAKLLTDGKLLVVGKHLVYSNLFSVGNI